MPLPLLNFQDRLGDKVAMSQGNPDTYQDFPLDHGKRTCRVFTLFPGVGRERLCGNIHIQDLDEKSQVPYICLSYVWGELKFTKSLFIANQELWVTKNLVNCLYHLRKSHDPVALWVDAICINQQDIHERSFQVGLMGDIYSASSMVYLWLGAPTTSPLTQDPFAIIRHFGGDHHYHELPGFTRTHHGAMAFEQSEEFSTLWGNFLLIANSSWWTRSWTVQEAVLPRIATVIYGSWSIPFDLIILCRRNRNDHIVDSRQCGCPQALQVFPNELRRPFDVFLQKVEFVEKLRIHHHLTTRSEDHADGLHWTGTDPFRSEPKFGETLQTFSSRMCHDPHDKIFSLLAMTSSEHLRSFKPDYRINIVDCCTDVFRRILADNGNDYRTLLGASFGSKLPGLPSWVRDFSKVLSLDMVVNELRRLETYDLFDASAGKRGTLTIHGGISLHVKGVHADTVKSVSQAVDSIHFGAVDLKHVVAQWVKICEATIDSDDPLQVKSAFSRVLCATLVADCETWNETGQWYRRMTDDDRLSDIEWRGILNGDKTVFSRNYEPGIAINITGRPFFVTETRRMGFGSGDIQPEDEIWILYGSRVPFILRKSMLPSSSHGTYHLVGDCFLDNIMDGEALKGDVTEESLTIS